MGEQLLTNLSYSSLHIITPPRAHGIPTQPPPPACSAHKLTASVLVQQASMLCFDCCAEALPLDPSTMPQDSGSVTFPPVVVQIEHHLINNLI